MSRDKKEIATNKKTDVKKVASILLVVIYIIFLYIFNSTLEYQRPADTESGNVYEKARVVAVENDTLAPDPDFPAVQIGRQDLTMVITTGEHKGETVVAKNFVERLQNCPAKVGTIMVISSYDDFVYTTIVGYSREKTIYFLAVLFAAVVLAFGRKKGVRSLFSLAITLASIIFMFVPMVIRGANPVLSASIVSLIITVITLVSLNGLSKKSAVAILSCVLCTSLSGIISMIAGTTSGISTLNTVEAQDLMFLSLDTPLKMHQMLFAGILFSSLGAIMDTSISLSSALFEMKEVNPSLKKTELIKSGFNIGRDIMGTMTNTLILAFAGGSINLFVIYYMYEMQYTQMINIDHIVVEIIRGLSGSIAVVLSIPITVMLSAFALTDFKGFKKTKA